MPLVKSFIKYIKDQNLFQQNDLLILGVSGGIDSVVLTELCQQAGYNFVIAHCNFHLRGEESDRDENFVRNLAEKYAAAIYIKHFNTEEYARQNKVSIQVAARELRYSWFAELLEHLPGKACPMPEKLAADNISNLPAEAAEIPFLNKGTIGGKSWLLTAHHANDNIETLLMNFFKGTGIKGLQGILPKHGKIIRPVLFAKKNELIRFAEQNNLSFVEDSSNLSNKYTRNYFRNEWLPGVQKFFPQVEENLIDNIERFREIEILYTQAIVQHRNKLIEFRGNELHIPLLKLLLSTPLKTILFEILKDFGFTPPQTVEVINILHSNTGKFINSATHRAFKNRKWLIIAPLLNTEASNILIEVGETLVEFPEGVLKFEALNQAPDDLLKSSPGSVVLDKGEIVYPLLLRKWKPGDYFYPLGLKTKKSGKPGKKKLSKYFIDRKLSLSDKEKIWVLESNKRLIWIIGDRLDERFKITSKTKHLLAVQFNKSEKYPSDQDFSRSR